MIINKLLQSYCFNISVRLDHEVHDVLVADKLAECFPEKQFSLIFAVTFSI